MYVAQSGYGIAFDGAGLLSFGDEFCRNVEIFGVAIISSSHVDNRKNIFLLLGDGPTALVQQRKRLVFILPK